VEVEQEQKVSEGLEALAEKVVEPHAPGAAQKPALAEKMSLMCWNLYSRRMSQWKKLHPKLSRVKPKQQP
jgi:hypothetical protein